MFYITHQILSCIWNAIYIHVHVHAHCHVNAHVQYIESIRYAFCGIHGMVHDISYGPASHICCIVHLLHYVPHTAHCIQSILKMVFDRPCCTLYTTCHMSSAICWMYCGTAYTLYGVSHIQCHRRNTRTDMNNVVQHHMIHCDVVWYGMACHDLISWYGMICAVILIDIMIHYTRIYHTI